MGRPGAGGFVNQRLFFPVIGLIIGTLRPESCGPDLILAVFFPLSALTVVIMIAASGALHMDGLAEYGGQIFQRAKPATRCSQS